MAQSLQLYGVPSFRRDTSGNEYHGDARNEYGLLALNNFLGVGNRAYVVRANIDLTDTPETFLSMGTPEVSGVVDFQGDDIFVTNGRVKPQTFTVRFSSSSSFSVTGSETGYIKSGTVGLPFTSNFVNFDVVAGDVPFAANDYFSFNVDYVAQATNGNTGNGRVINLDAGELAIPETYTIVFTSPTSFDVTGTVSGNIGTGFVNAEFSDGNTNGQVVSFTIVPGSTAFVSGDEFVITVAEVTVSDPLGANDAARRVAITTALQAEINSNVEVRSSMYEFNLILCPGYPEVADELVALSVAVQSEALVIADTPGNMSPEQVAQWALTSERQSTELIAYYYPWTLQSNMDGRNVMGAPSGTALRTIAFSDNAGYVWTPPAGVARGQVSGVSKVISQVKQVQQPHLLNAI